MIRLAGLYTTTRGLHAYWLHRARDSKDPKDATIPGAADAVVNLLHYEDAASAVLALMAKPGTVYSTVRQVCSRALAMITHIVWRGEE